MPKIDSDDQYLGTDSSLKPSAEKGHELEFFFVPSGGTENPLTVKFMAFLTQFEDNYTSEWTADKVYGRMDPIATFQGTTRTISLGWAVPAFSGEEAENNLKKMSKLISMCYPVYGGQSSSSRGAGQISGAPLIKLKFANLITATQSSAGAAENGLLGWIDGISFKPDLEAGFYDPSPNKLYPKQIDLSCQFHALHQHALGWLRGGTVASDGKAATEGGLSKNKDSGNFPYGSVFKSGGQYEKEDPPLDPPADEQEILPGDIASNSDGTNMNTQGNMSPAAKNMSVAGKEVLQ